jgi:hypothetical protein
MQISTIGVDLAKHVFEVHGVDSRSLLRASWRIAASQSQRSWLADLRSSRLSESCLQAAFLLCEPHRSQLSHSSDGKQGGVG